MTTAHPTSETLLRFITARLSAAEFEEARHHLVDAACAPCLFAVRELIAETQPGLEEVLLHLQDPQFSEEERQAGFRYALECTYCRTVALSAERGVAPGLLTELEPLPSKAQREAARTDPRYQLFAFAEYLSEESRRAGFRDVDRAIELARLAVEVADHLDPRIYLPGVTFDQRALTRAFLGNARRVASDLHGAEGEFREAGPFLEHGSKSPIVRGTFLDLLSSLRIDRGQYPEARRILSEVLEMYRRLRSSRYEAKALLKLANVEGYAGRPEKAVAALRKAQWLIEGESDQRLLLYLRHNLADWLVAAGDGLEALAEFEKAQHLYDAFQDDPWVQLRREWLRARIYAALGELDLAKRAFDEIRRIALDREFPYEFAMIGLEEAIVDLNRGEATSARRTAAEILPILRSRDLHRHSLATLSLFVQAALKEILPSQPRS